MVRFVCAAVVAAIVIAPSIAAAQPVPPVRLSVATDGTQANGVSSLVAVSAERPARPVQFDGVEPRRRRHQRRSIDLFVRDRDTDARRRVRRAGRRADAPRLDRAAGEHARRRIGDHCRICRGRTLRAVLDAVGAGRERHERHRRTATSTTATPTRDGVFDEPGAAAVAGDAPEPATRSRSAVQHRAAGHRRMAATSSSARGRRTCSRARRPVTQIYRKDRVTGVTTLVSSTPDGTPADIELPAISAVMRDDGRIVALGGGFQALWPLSAGVVTYPWVMRDLEANTFTPVPARRQAAGPRPTTCRSPKWPGSRQTGNASSCPICRARFWACWASGPERQSNTTSPAAASSSGCRASDRPPASVFVDGRSLPLITRESFSPSAHCRANSLVTTAVTGRVTRLVPYAALSATPPPLIAGRCTGRSASPPTLLDERYGVPLPMPAPVQTGRLDATGTTVFFASADASILPGGADTNGVDDVFAVDLLSRLDRDGDAPRRSLGDRHGARLRQRRRRGRGDRRSRRRRPDQPAGAGRRYRTRVARCGQFLAEGADNAFFKTRLGIANPGTTAATAVVRFDGDGGASTTRSTSTCRPAPSAPCSSTRSRRRRASFADRRRVERRPGHRAHRELGRDRVRRARRARQRGARDVVVPRRRRHRSASRSSTCCRTPATRRRPRRSATCGRRRSPPIERTYHAAAALAHDAAGRTRRRPSSRTPTCPPRSPRRSRSWSSARCIARVDGQVFAAGHASAGVTAAATSWFLAEGATGDFFDMFVLLANPTTTAADVEIRYLLTTGEVLTKSYTVAPESRRTIYVDGETFPGLGQALVRHHPVVRDHLDACRSSSSARCGSPGRR